jgi:hypothetical protein
LDQQAKLAVDAGAAVLAFGSFFGWLFSWLPVLLSVIASTLSIAWLGIQIYEWNRKRKQAAAGAAVTGSGA